MRLPSLVVLVLLAGCLQSAPQTASDGPDQELRDAVATSTMVRFETDRGDIDLIVYQELMPEHGRRFLDLVQSGFYDGTHVHRVVDDFVIQGGDPTGLGEGGSGQTIPHEHHPLLPFATGALGMARDQDPDSGDSQWFLTERPVLRLSDPDSDTAKEWGTFAMFGQVVGGMDVVRDIADEPNLPTTQRPLVPILVQRARIVEEDWDPRAYPLAAQTVGDGVVEQPLHVWAGHPFTLRAYSVSEPAVSFQRAEGTVPVRFVEVERGAWEATATLPEDGSWRRIVDLDGGSAVHTFDASAG